MVLDNSDDSLNNVVDGLCISGKDPSNQHEGEVNEAMGLPSPAQPRVLSAKEKLTKSSKKLKLSRLKYSLQTVSLWIISSLLLK